MNSFDTSGLDLSIIEDFESEEDIRSYLISKYGIDFTNKIIEIIYEKLDN